MTTYYTKQLSRVIHADKRGYKLMIISDSGATNWLNLNLDSIDALETFIATVKADLVAEVTQKVTVKQITIEWAEGYNGYCDQFPKTFDSFSDVNAFLLTNSHQFADNGGYDKHKFNVIWNDGDTEGYTGRLDCKHFKCSNNDLNMGQHIREFMQYICEQENDSEKGKAQNFLKNYQLA